MTCRISGWRSCPAALPRLHPRIARNLTPVRVERTSRPGDPPCLGPPLPADPLLSTGHPGGGRFRRPPGPPPRRGGGRLVDQSGILSRASENPNGTGDLWRYSPLPPVRVDTAPFRASVRVPDVAPTWGEALSGGPRTGGSRNSGGPEERSGCNRTAVRRSGPFQVPSGAAPTSAPPGCRRAGRASASADAVRRGATPERPGARRPGTRSACASVSPCSSVSPHADASAQARHAALPPCAPGPPPHADRGRSPRAGPG